MDPMLMAFMITSVSIVGGVTVKWLKLRAEHRVLGASNRELEQKVQRLERINAEHDQRLENLEAVVVSQTWGALHEPGLSEADRQRRVVATVRHEIQAPAMEDVNRQRTADLARRLGA